jgi:hypothetical protein
MVLVESWKKQWAGWLYRSCTKGSMVLRMGWEMSSSWAAMREVLLNIFSRSKMGKALVSWLGER